MTLTRTDVEATMARYRIDRELALDSVVVSARKAASALPGLRPHTYRSSGGSRAYRVVSGVRWQELLLAHPPDLIFAVPRDQRYNCRPSEIL